MKSKEVVQLEDAYRKREAEELIALSEEKNIQMSVLLMQIFQQNMVDKIAQNPKGKFLILKKGLKLRKFEQLTHKKEAGTIYLEYVFIDRNEKKETDYPQSLRDIVDEMTENIFPCGKTIVWNQQFEMRWNGMGKIEKNQMNLLLEGVYDQYHIPVHIRIQRELAMKQEGQEESFPYILNEGKEISYLAYPSEEILGDYFMDILEKPKLLQDMEQYDKIYEILSEKSLNARKIQSIIVKKCRQRNTQNLQEKFQKMLSYRNDSDLHKKWMAYLKLKGAETPQWWDVMDLMNKFYSPIVKASEENSILLKDWMPELQRYLG